MADEEGVESPELETVATTEETTTEEETNDGATEVTEEDEGNAEEGDEGEGSPEVPSKPATAKAKSPDKDSEEANWRKEREQLIERAARAEALEQERNRQAQEHRSHEDRRAEEARLALLDPAERAAYSANKKANDLEYRLNMLQMQIADNNEKAVFSAKAAHDELYAKHLDEVEKMYQDGLNRGVRANREHLLSFILGEELKKDRSAKVSAKKVSASKRIDSVTSKPASVRGDVAGSKKGKSEEERLRGVFI